ncbi:putative ribosomal large subunit pseudouridine synthase SVR1, chloroplastic [Cucurbita maxima]|uniref:Ribosomal large subunit pseudouridine synthase SVR1, chloroplastic n=1 Tax=Cucurbita maxima TaxID=3661 RepID=A0A6J1JT41_CUCMA|nr:putative ribosomal large subunit pseudouridine synthase SVR1, chloroplastic [Cucurbita maxima]
MVSLAASSLSVLSKPSLILNPIRAISRISCSLSSNSAPNGSSSSSSSMEFNITFAPPTPKPKSKTDDSFQFIDQNTGGQLFIPWIVRGEDGNLKLQSHPPTRFLHSMSEAEAKPKKKKVSVDKRVPEPPKYSKAARRFYNENIRDSSQRLSKVLAAAGVASRRSSEELIFEGRVTVNGSVCNTPQTRVDPARDIIYVNGNRLPKKLPSKVYLALNKPKGYICSSGKKESKSVINLFDDYLKSWHKTYPGQPKPRLFTVGRLDVATTGLIIVTNDGDFAQSISHPSSGISKEYIAAIDGAVSKQNLITISEGTVIDGVHCIPDAVELLPQQPDIPRSRLRITVHEGRNHEVRELVKAAGLEIYSLKRVRIGGFRLPSDLGLGSYIELKQCDLKAIGWKS